MIPESILARRDPTVKLVLVLVLSLLLVAVIDPVTPLLFLALTLGAGLVLGRTPVAALARPLVPLLVVAAGFAWSNAAFAVPPPGATVWEFGPLRLSDAGLRFGLAIGLRGLAIGALSVVFVRTTDPTLLVVSLIRNARLPFRIGYALLAGYRFLPFLGLEVERVRLAQRVRGELAAAGPLAGVRFAARSVVPLLSEAVRRASRTAIAMDARGFGVARKRTYYRRTPIVAADVAFAAASIAAGAALLVLGAAGGWLRLWDGRFAA